MTVIPIESDIMLCVTNALKEITPYVYFGKSQTVYPKINCDLRLFSETQEYCQYRLVLDYYANNGKPVTVVNMSETVREIFYGGQAWTAEGALITFQKDGDGKNVEDRNEKIVPNEKIVHYEDAYEVYYYKNTEI